MKIHSHLGNSLATDPTFQNYLIKIIQTKLIGYKNVLEGSRSEATTCELIKGALHYLEIKEV